MGHLNLNGGVIKSSADNADFLARLPAANINVQSGGLKFDTNGHADTITQALSGVGGVTKQGAGTLTFSVATNYSGDTTVLGGTLSFSSIGLADSSLVALTGGSTLNLAFAGSDTISGFVIDGVTQALGTWGAVGSGAQHESALITGSGLLTVGVPEPATVGLVVAGMTLLALRGRHRRRN